MSDCGRMYELVCREEFARLHEAISSLDEVIRGNSREGLLVRIERIEAAHRSLRRLERAAWLLLGAALTLGARLVVEVVAR